MKNLIYTIEKIKQIKILTENNKYITLSRYLKNISSNIKGKYIIIYSKNNFMEKNIYKIQLNEETLTYFKNNSKRNILEILENEEIQILKITNIKTKNQLGFKKEEDFYIKNDDSLKLFKNQDIEETILLK